MKRDLLLSAAGLLLLGLVVLGAIRLQEDRDRTAPDPNKVVERPALILDTVVAETFGARGTLAYRLFSDHARRFDHEERTLLTTPHLQLHDEGLDWEIRARDGALEAGGKRVHMRQEVQARHLPHRLELETSELVYFLESERLEAPAPLRMTHPSGVTRAGAMEVDLASGIMELRASVESRYEPQSP